MMITLSLAAAALLVGVDWLLKQLAIQYLSPVTTLPIWDGVLHLTYHENTGAAFSILRGHTELLVAVTAVALVAIVVFLLVKKPKSRFLVCSLALILAGGVGNLIDRLTQGFVVDYIDFRLIHFPVFNFADCCAVIGTILLIGYLFFHDIYQVYRAKRAPQPEAAEEEPSTDAPPQEPPAPEA